jgi:predicted NBD/HSP70 family sugar kinase
MTINNGHARLTARPRVRLSAPQLSARVSAEVSASVLARLIASGAAVTRAALARETGLARSTVSLGLSTLERIGLVRADGAVDSAGRGRPGELLTIAPDYGLILTAEIDLAGTSVAVFDFGQNLVLKFEIALSTDRPPLDFVTELAGAMIARIDALDTRVRLKSAVVAIPAPVDARRGVVVRPPLLPGWDEFAVASELARLLECPVTVDNDADLRALGEARGLPESASPLLYVRIDTGIGAGFMDGTAELFVGADGAAGDIGHMRTGIGEGRVCSCGERDHLEAHAALPAMVQRWRESAPGRVGDDRYDFERALREGDGDAVRIARDAARIIGAALTDILLMFNPRRISVGGVITSANDVVLAGIRSVVYEVGRPLSTRNLTVAASELGEDAALHGGLVLGLEQGLGVEAISAALASIDRSAARA